MISMEMRGVALATIARIRASALREPRQIRLGDLLHHKRRVERSSCENRFIKFANVLREEMPVRFSHQLMGYYRLPYIVWSCEPFLTVHDAHLRAFEELSAFRELKTVDDVFKFTDTLRHHLEDTDSIGSFRSGLSELQAHGFGGEDLLALHPFLDSFIVTRIGNQVLANHFLDWVDREQFGETSSQHVITECYKLSPMLTNTANQVCNLAMHIYGVRPEVSFNEYLDIKVSVLPSHLQFIFREVLKNAVHATMQQHIFGRQNPKTPPPVQVTIRSGTFDVELRVSDQGGGMNRKMLRSVWEYGFTGSPWPPMAADLELSSLEEASRRLHLQMSGYGMGIPLSRHYARFFGGDLQFSSIYGFGTDVSIRLNRLLSIQERHEAEFGSVTTPAELEPSIFDLELAHRNGSAA